MNDKNETLVEKRERAAKESAGWAERVHMLQRFLPKPQQIPLLSPPAFAV